MTYMELGGIKTMKAGEMLKPPDKGGCRIRMKLSEITKSTKVNNNTKQGNCQRAKKLPPEYLYCAENYKQFMHEQGKSEEEIRVHGDNEWKNEKDMWIMNYGLKFNEPCPIKFPFEPWHENIETPAKKTKQEKIIPKQFQPEIRIPASVIKWISIDLDLNKLEYTTYLIIATQILQWKQHRDNGHTRKIGPTEISKISKGKLKPEQAMKAIKQLEEKGAIEIIRKKSCKTNKKIMIKLVNF